MSISKYRLTENDVQEMVMSTAKRILENKQLLEGVVNEMREGKSAINEDQYYGTTDYSNPPSFFSGERNFGPQMPPYMPMPGQMMPQYPYPYMPMPRPMMPPPPTRPGNGLLKYLLFRNYINNHINALGDYYHGAGGTHENPSAGGGSSRSGGRGGYGGGRGGSRRGGASTPGGTSGGTSGGTDGASGGTGGSSGGTANTTPVKEIPPTAPVGPSPIDVPTPPKPITPPVRRDPVVGGGGGGSNINRSSSHDNTIHGSHNQISNDDHSSRVDNSVQNHTNSHNTTTNVNQTQNYDQRSSVNTNNVHIGGDRNYGSRRGGGGGRPSISRHGHDHDHGPRRDFDGNGGGMHHRGHGGYDSGRGGRRPRI